MTIEELLNTIEEINNLKKNKEVNEKLPLWETNWTKTDEFTLNRLLNIDLQVVEYDED